MSLFLGKIHYLLFDKILWFESIEGEIIDLAKDTGLDIDSLSKEINKKHGAKLPKEPLENMIDTSNIHGWLQSKIHSAEGRMAAWTTATLKHSKEASSRMESIYIQQGKKAAKEVQEKNLEYSTAPDIFNRINDYILDGMPCDRVNEIVSSDESSHSWIRRLCVHEDIWNTEKGDVKYFYTLRGLWIRSFVETVNSDFEYVEEEDGLMLVRRIVI
jgi:hypothetical protein